MYSLDGIWIRINIDEQRTGKKQTMSSWYHATTNCSNLPRNVLYIVYFPHSKYLLSSGLTAAHKKFVLHSLQSALKCHKITDYKLQGNDLGTTLLFLFLIHRSVSEEIVSRRTDKRGVQTV